MKLLQLLSRSSYLLFLLYGIQSFSQEVGINYTDRDVYNITRRAILQIPTVRTEIKKLGKDISKTVGINMDSVPYIATGAMVGIGRFTTKYFTFTRYRERSTTVQPMVDYWFKENNLRLEIIYQYDF